MSDTTHRLTNLYQMLNLAPLESDSAEILAALDRVQAKVEALKKAGQRPEDQARLQKLFALAKKTLLNEQAKAAYDTQWQSHYGQPLQSPAKNQPHADSSAAKRLTWDLSSLESLLPSQDPFAPFNMAACLSSSSTRDPAAVEADLQRLIDLLGGGTSGSATSPLDTATHARSGSSLAGTLDGHNTATGSSAQESTLSLAPPAASAHGPGLTIPRDATGGAAAAATLARRLRKKRQQSMLIGGGLLLLGMGGLGVLGLYLNQPKRPGNTASLAQARSAAADRAAQAAGAEQRTANGDGPSEVSQASDSTGTPSVSRSGLIQPGENVQPMQIEAMVPGAPGSDAPGSAPAASATPNVPAMPAATAPATTMPVANAPAPVPDATPAPSSEVVAEQTMRDAQLSTQDKQAWKNGMMAVQSSLGKLEVTAAQEKLEELKASAKTSLQRQQHQRLIEVSGWIQSARQAMVDAIAGLQGADTFKVGNTVASFIEGDENKIVLRIAGERRQYALSDLPPRIGEALIDLKLDIAHANSLAAKGAYFVLHPKNDLVVKRGKQMLDESAAAGAISKASAHFYEDDYGLSQSSQGQASGSELPKG